MKIAAAYVRVSDERQDEYSPDSQINLIRKRKEEVVEVKQAVCQTCGHSLEIDY